MSRLWPYPGARWWKFDFHAHTPVAKNTGAWQAAKSALSKFFALYWRIFHLDFNNPNAKAGLEHADPKELIASMRSHEAEVMHRLGEIESLVAEGQA